MTAFEDQRKLLELAEPELERDEVTLHWFLRNVLSQEDLDTYEFVFDVPRLAAGVRFDAAYVEEEPGDGDGFAVNLIELTLTNSPQAVKSRVDQILEAISPPSSADHPSKLSQLVGDLGLRTPKKLDALRTRFVLHVVAPRVRLSDTALPAAAEHVEVHAYDKIHLDRVARAISGPAAVQETLLVTVDDAEVLETPIQSGSVFVCPVTAVEIAGWPGIEDRSLFDLNVRLKLGGRRVRQSLDAALSRDDDAGDFLAFHNGLTVVCDRVRRTGSGIEVTNFSVVNGTQSVIAFYENRQLLSSDVRVLVKFAVVGTTTDSAREIAIRSNTQNPVTTRNLRALDARQLTLKTEFDELYPDYEYEIRPDAGGRTSRELIHNDDAAQLLCAVYNEKPWLAVKRLVLFEQPHYGQIFHPRISAAHVIMSHEIRRSIQSARDSFPPKYQKAWQLTALVATYLVGQILRSNDDLRQILDHPGQHLNSQAKDLLTRLAYNAAEVLRERAEEISTRPDLPDDFKVDFKRESALRALASRARRSASGA